MQNGTATFEGLSLNFLILKLDIHLWGYGFLNCVQKILSQASKKPFFILLIPTAQILLSKTLK